MPARATSTSRGAASPGRWVYDDQSQDQRRGLEPSRVGNYIHLPGGFTADVKTDSFSTEVNLNSLLTTPVNFAAPQPSGLPRLISGFGAASDSVLRQIERKNLAVNELRGDIAPFTLDVNASGRGLRAVPASARVESRYHLRNHRMRLYDTGRYHCDGLPLVGRQPRHDDPYAEGARKTPSTIALT